MTFYAHSDKSQPEPGDKWQLLEEHLRHVAKFAHQRAVVAAGDTAELATAAWWAGLLHDVGKYRPEFQAMIRRLRRKGVETRHKQAGAAWAAVSGHWDIATAIAGHHGGMPDAADLTKRIVNGPGGKDVAAKVRSDAIREISELSATMPTTVPPTDALAFDVRVRMLFSCLVDADWTDTGEHERRAKGLPSLPEPPRLSHELADTLLKRVLEYIDSRAVACLIDDDTFPVVVGSWKSRTKVVQSLLDELARAPSTRLFLELGRYQLNLRHYEKCSLGKFLSLESASIQVWRGKYDDRVGLVPEMDDFDCVV